MAVAATTDEKGRVSITGKGGEFTALVRRLPHAKLMRALIDFGRVERAQKRFRELVPVTGEGEEAKAAAKLAMAELTDEQQDEVLEVSAQLDEHYCHAGAHALDSVEGLHDGNGNDLKVPDSFEGRVAFIEKHFSFVQKQFLAKGVIDHNAVSENDQGN